ncbi:MAG: ATP-binding cassette domain-containing protein [Streptosporangiaceae bacterium]
MHPRDPGAPRRGTATVAGHDLRTDPAGVRRSISLTGQYAAIDDKLTGQENLEMMARLRRLPRAAPKARAAELLAAFGLLAARHRRTSAYSGGMRRRLDLAMSMIERPQLLFLDEPTTGLDPRSREQVWDSVRDLATAGVTILLTTQYLEEADQFADAVVMLDRGRVVAQGTAAQLKASIGAEVVRLQFTDSASYARACPPRGNRAHPMSAASMTADSRVMVTRCVRRSLRDPEAFFTALMLPVILMLMFVYVFGGELRTGVRYVDNSPTGRPPITPSSGKPGAGSRVSRAGAGARRPRARRPAAWRPAGRRSAAASSTGPRWC